MFLFQGDVKLEDMPPFLPNYQKSTVSVLASLTCVLRDI